MLDFLGYPSMEALIEATVPTQIRLRRPLDLPAGRGEYEVLAELRAIASKNQIFKTFIGAGYSDCITPPVIQRNILENPGWYTAYTPYQAEISQGRLEVLLNFQTMIRDLTGMDIANASMLDEATAAAEAMALCWSQTGREKDRLFFVSSLCHPQTIEVIQTRAKPLGITVLVADSRKFDFKTKLFGAVLQYPTTEGGVEDYRAFIEKLHQDGAMAIVAADLLGLTILTPPGEFGADVVVGSAQRFGVPLGYGGPHAGFFATRDAYKRNMPGRLIGVSHDAQGKPALRLSLQTREQHIRRDKATSNICTAQVLLAVIAATYAVYHGPEGLRRIARRVRGMAATLAEGLKKLGCRIENEICFDTVCVQPGAQKAEAILKVAQAHRVNLRLLPGNRLSIALDETTSMEDVRLLLKIFNEGRDSGLDLDVLAASIDVEYPVPFARSSDFLTHPVFNQHHTETELLRYLKRLENKDLSLTTSMIPLGSCTMKLNATAEMFPVTWPEFGKLHPFIPLDQALGYQEMFRQLEQWLAEITGFAAVSLQPNAGSQGEYAGLLAIREYHERRGEGHRNICLIPLSAHGTNPASAVMAGFKVVPIACDEMGNINVADLKARAIEHVKDLAAIMVTYPSTHGVFEESIKEICEIVHSNGGQVYMDGANMNAQVGLCRPGDMGADVCHLNLHKTFCIPHGGGGPGMGPIAVAPHLKAFLPDHSVIPANGTKVGAVSAAPWGSASILVISWVYIALLGGEGLTQATKVAILSANYVARQLEPHFRILYRGKNDLVAHECIIDLRDWKERSGVEVEDAAKRLMDYGFHAPTMSWPVPGTLMIEPTESESKEELDRFCDAMIAIQAEMQAIAIGEMPRVNNVLKNAPHTAQVLLAKEWDRPYSREEAAYPAPWLRESKYWPPVGRIDNVYGDRNLICTCMTVEEAQG